MKRDEFEFEENVLSFAMTVISFCLFPILGLFIIFVLMAVFVVGAGIYSLAYSFLNLG